VVADVRSGVVRIQATGCEKPWSGTGFLVESPGDNLLVTAGHVARNASVLSVKADRGIVRAEVVGYDMSSDVAVLRLDQPLEGHRFTLDVHEAPLGQDIGVLGYPFGVTDLRLSRGTVSSGDTSVTYDGDEGFTVDHVITTDAAVNGGNSGGPAIEPDGPVIGLVTGAQNWNGDPSNPAPAQGNNFLVPARVIDAKYKHRQDLSGEREPCDDDSAAPADPDTDLDVTVRSDDEAAGDIALSLYQHGAAINQGRYDAAWQMFTAREQRALNDDVERWQEGLASSFWDSIVVKSVSRRGDAAQAKVALRTRQDAAYGNGQTCSDWSMTYSMVRSHGTWLIDRVAASRRACS
jgi:serine protease Do